MLSRLLHGLLSQVKKEGTWEVINQGITDVIHDRCSKKEVPFRAYKLVEDDVEDKEEGAWSP